MDIFFQLVSNAIFAGVDKVEEAVQHLLLKRRLGMGSLQMDLAPLVKSHIVYAFETGSTAGATRVATGTLQDALAKCDRNDEGGHSTLDLRTLHFRHAAEMCCRDEP